MVMLETATLLLGIGLSSAVVTDTQMQSMEQCTTYLARQAERYSMFLAKDATQLEIKYRIAGSEFTVTRTCISY